jgi:signal transduction histidine kinase
MILDTSGDAMLAWDRAGHITDANAAASALTGLSREDLIGADIRDLFGELPDPAESRHGVRLALSARGGTADKVIVSATITAVEDDPMVAAHALLRDRSQVVLAEREAALHLSRVRELEQELRTLLDNAPLVIFRLAPDSGELRYLNRHAERLLGVPTAEALHTPGFLRAAHASDEDAAAFDAAVSGAKLGCVSPPYEGRLRWGDREEIAVRGTVYPLLGDAGEVVAIEGVLEDVSTERAARTRLVQADRLSTIGTLAAGVAHEINNPAAFILLGMDMLDRLLSGPGVRMDELTRRSQTELVRELREAIKRIVDIARDLRLFVGPPRPESGAGTIVDVNRTVQSALSLTRGQILERAKIVPELREVPPVLMDDGRLGQVVVNLLVNAAQAIPAQGGPGEHSVLVGTSSDGRTVEIEVVDTGVGISAHDIARIWTPFFTTKGPDTGTGLGLSISRDIVEGAGGVIRVESPTGSPARGARFVISLPAAGRDELRTPASTPLPRTLAHRARVLVVEDETALARALAEEIGQVHDVVVAEGGERALAMLRNQRFDAVLCDLRMPGMSGEAFYAAVWEMYPEQARAFIFMTGVGFGADVERFLMSSGRPVLEKPFATERALIEIAKVTTPRKQRARD